MDRLVCGDVGFGKTEVALRAAFVALADGKQVAVLVPTTLLAEQHFHVFSDRFADWPVKHRRAVALPLAEGGRRRRSRDSATGRIDLVDRHAQADPAGRQVQEPRPRDHRRGAPLRRAAEGAAQAPARRGRRADAHRDADPAHARDVAGGHPRLLGDRHGAAAAARDQDLRRDAVVGHRARGGAARAEARRPGLLPAQRRRHDPHDAPRSSRRCCPRRASRSRTGRCASASSST